MGRPKIFILEDNPVRIEFFGLVFPEAKWAVTVATTVEAGVLAWEPPYSIIFLDHDLEKGHAFSDPDHPATGAEFIRQLPALGEEGLYCIHSMHYEGAKEMKRLLKEKGADKISRCPFGTRDFVLYVNAWKSFEGIEE